MFKGLNEEEYKKILNSVGKDESDLLGVLDQALHHNKPNTFHLGIMSSLSAGGSLQEISEFIDGRIALVSRHMIDAQKALQEIYEVSKREEYQPIMDIFERTYHIGHARKELVEEGVK